MQFEKNIIHRPASNTSNWFVREKSLGHYIIRNLVSGGDKTVLVCGLTGQKLSAMELLNKSFEIANALLENGIKQGDVVSIISENRFELVFVFLGTIFINAVFAPLNHTYSERELAHALNLSKPQIIFTSAATTNTIFKMSRELGFVKKIILFDDCVGPSDDLAESLKNFVNRTILKPIHFEPQPVNILTSHCLILCSSGTTGLAKGVQLSQFGVFATISDLNEFMITKANVGDGDVTFLGFPPMFHLMGLAFLIMALQTVGGKLVMLPKFEEKTFLGCIEKYRCSVAALVPPLLVFLAKHPQVDKYNLDSLRLIVGGAAPISKELEQSVRDRLNNPNLVIKQLYAMTELASISMQKSVLKAGSIGDVNSNMFAKVTDENNNAIGPNKLGELCFKGPAMMMGYVGDELATKTIIDAEGWLHTGDIGYYDDDLQFFIVDRIKELIKWKGNQVPPAEIEALLLTHPKVRDCGVIGKQDDFAGELPLAFIVKADPTLTETEIVQYVNELSSPAKRLYGGVRFVDQIPKNPSGKILRRVLRALISQENVKAKL